MATVNDVHSPNLSTRSGIHPLAKELNDCIESSSSIVLQMLSTTGYRTFYPKDGIPAQAATAKKVGVVMDATVGTAFEDSSIMHLQCIKQQIPSLDPHALFPYASAWGIDELRLAWRDQLLKKNPEVNASMISHPIVVSGLTHALYVIARLFCNLNDPVLVPGIRWDNYDLIFENQVEGTLVPYNLIKNGQIDIMSIIKEIRKLKKPNKVILILNFPNNPTGYTPNKSEVLVFAEALKELAKEGRKILVICDDAYFGLAYEENSIKSSIFVYLCDLHENILVVKVDGVSKEDYAWGFRVGFLTFGIKGGNSFLYNALNDKVAAITRASVASVNHASQSILVQAFKDPNYQEEKQSKFMILHSKYLEVIRVLKESTEFHHYYTCVPFNSGYFLSVQPKDLSGNEIRLCLLNHYKIGIVCFGDLLRICFARLEIHQIKTIFDSLVLAAKQIQFDKREPSSSTPNEEQL